MKSAALLIFLVSTFCEITLAQDFRQVHPGVEYAKVRKEIGGKYVDIDLLRLDLKKVRLDVVHAFDGVIGMEKASSMAKRKGAIAAINAGFFRLDKSAFAGDPAGVLRIDSKLLSESGRSYPTIGIINRGGETRVAFVGLSERRVLRISDRSFFLGTDRERKADDIVEYTPEFGRRTPSGTGCLEITLKKNRISKVNETCGSEIPADGFVISATGEKATLLKASANLNGKAKMSLWTVMDDARPARDFKIAEDVVNGRGHLLRDGKRVAELSETNKAFVETRHPRTAVAKLRDGKFLMITVDGRTEASGGIGLADLADFLLTLGATDAINLDGGGSTTMYLDGKVVNHPSDKGGERKVSDAIIVTLRNKL